MKKGLCLLVIVAFLVGCKTHKAVIDENTSAVLVDTSRAMTDSMTTRQTHSDTTHISMATEEVTLVSFVDGGGTVGIDSSGNVTLTGVRIIKGSLARRVVQEGGVSMEENTTQVHTDSQDGLIEMYSRAIHSEKETKADKPAWYQTILAKFGGLCCIAALLWLLFLYLKRKL